jgi:hypothetical protein
MRTSCRRPSGAPLRLMARAILALALLWLVAPGIGVAQIQTIRVIESSHAAEFADRIEFRLAVESDAPIESIALYQQLVGEIVRARTDIEFEASARVDALHVWHMAPGELVPGTEIAYWWVVRDRGGRELTTSTETLRYEDNRFEWTWLNRGELDLAYYSSAERDAQDILDAGWSAVAALHADAGLKLDQRVAIYVYANEGDMRPALSSRGSIYDDRTLTLGVAAGGDTLLLLGSHRDVAKTVAHELSHIVVGLATENPYVNLPRWLDEGLAMYAEGELPASNARSLERGVREDRLISVRSLSGYVGDPDQVDLFYAEVHSLIEFMIDVHGREAMSELLETIAGGVLAEDAVQQVYGMDLDELDEAWRASLGLGPRLGAEQWPESSARSHGSGLCGGPLGILLGSAFVLAAASTRR